MERRDFRMGCEALFGAQEGEKNPSNIPDEDCRLGEQAAGQWDISPSIAKDQQLSIVHLFSMTRSCFPPLTQLVL